MSITGTPASSLLDSVLAAQGTQEQIGVSVLKKAQDVEKQEGQALVQMLEQAGPKPLLDTYA